MAVIRIETTLESDSPHLPQLQPLVGKSVEIVVRERAVPTVTAPISDWEAVEAAVLALNDYGVDDVDTVREARELEVRRAGQERP